MAIGFALLLGFRFPMNFNSPYKADSITDFWHRWHISLFYMVAGIIFISHWGETARGRYVLILICALLCC